MLNVTYLKTALQKALEDNQALVDLTKHGDIDIRTGQERITIAERGPNTAAIYPYIGYEVIDTEPLAKDDPTTGYYWSLVFIFVVAETSPRTTHIADHVHSMFTKRPNDQPRTWYYDLSSDCITNHYTKFISRVRFGREGQNVFNHENSSWMEAIEIKVWWSDRGCQEDNEGCCTPMPLIDIEPLPSDYVDCDC